jgi:hypothetical protein
MLQKLFFSSSPTISGIYYKRVAIVNNKVMIASDTCTISIINDASRSVNDAPMSITNAPNCGVTFKTLITIVICL